MASVDDTRDLPGGKFDPITGQLRLGSSIAGSAKNFFERAFAQPDQSFLSNPRINPAGAAGERTSELGVNLGRALRGSLPTGFSSAQNLLDQEGRVSNLQEQQDRRAVETQRQQLQQDISQRAATTGTTGAIGTSAIQGLADQAAVTGKGRVAEDAIFGREQRKRGDIANILQDLLGGSALDLQAARFPAQEDTRATGAKNFIGTVGNVFGAFGSLAGGERQGGK